MPSEVQGQTSEINTQPVYLRERTPAKNTDTEPGVPIRNTTQMQY